MILYSQIKPMMCACMYIYVQMCVHVCKMLGTTQQEIT